MIAAATGVTITSCPRAASSSHDGGHHVKVRLRTRHWDCKHLRVVHAICASATAVVLRGAHLALAFLVEENASTCGVTGAMPGPDDLHATHLQHRAGLQASRMPQTAARAPRGRALAQLLAHVLPFPPPLDAEAAAPEPPEAELGRCMARSGPNVCHPAADMFRCEAPHRSAELRLVPSAFPFSQKWKGRAPVLSCNRCKCRLRAGSLDCGRNMNTAPPPQVPRACQCQPREVFFGTELELLAQICA